MENSHKERGGREDGNTCQENESQNRERLVIVDLVHHRGCCIGPDRVDDITGRL